MKEFDSHELAWAAGFFDGEGCTSTSIRILKSRYKSRHIQIQISQNINGHFLLERFHKAIGGIYCGKRYQWNNSIYRRGGLQVKYTVSRFEYVQYTIAVLWKYLGPIKKQQYKDCLKKYQTFRS